MHLSTSARRRASFQVGHVRGRVGIDDDAGVEQVVRIGERLEPLHHRVPFGAPLGLDKRRHVAAGAVLGLERAIVFVHHQLDDVVNEVAILRDFRSVLKPWVMTKWRLPSLAWPKMMALV
jgi:hypothetical protein